MQICMLTCIWLSILRIFICRNPKGLEQECVAACAQLNGKHSSNVCQPCPFPLCLLILNHPLSLLLDSPSSNPRQDSTFVSQCFLYLTVHANHSCLPKCKVGFSRFGMVPETALKLPDDTPGSCSRDRT